MNVALLPLFVAVPLVSAALLTLAAVPSQLRQVALLAPNAAALLTSAALTWLTRDGAVFAHNIALWQNRIAIPFVVDVFSALMLTTTALLALVCSGFAVATGEAHSRYFGPLILVLSAGVYGALLTGDLFNLFVFIEVMLLPSYGLLAMAGTLRRLRGGRIYVTVNLLTSTIFLSGVALVYGVSGTVHLGELSGTAQDSPVMAAGMGVVMLALSVKAAVVPVHGWLARTYPTTSPAVTALFSGLHTKVAIYAIYRLYAVVFDGDSSYLWIGLVMFTFTMAIGVLGAVGENTTRSILVFHMISQIGYILLGVALFTEIGLMAGIFYLIHHMIVKASLFLSTGAVEHTYGTGRLDRLGGIAYQQPLLGIVFMGAALSLAGLPPMSGFVAKLTLVTATIDAGQWIVAAVAIAVSLITLMSMLKIWGGVFWGREPESDPDTDEVESGPDGGTALTIARQRTKVRVAVLLPALVLTATTLCIGLSGQFLLELSSQAASGLLDPSPYVEAVTS